METLSNTFGGATAFPRGRGVWRDDERGGVLVNDKPIVIHCYTTPEDIQAITNLVALRRFLKTLGRETHQGFVISDEYQAIRDFTEE